MDWSEEDWTTDCPMHGTYYGNHCMDCHKEREAEAKINEALEKLEDNYNMGLATKDYNKGFSDGRKYALNLCKVYFRSHTLPKTIREDIDNYFAMLLKDI
jgi:hypothetical protein